MPRIVKGTPVLAQIQGESKNGVISTPITPSTPHMGNEVLSGSFFLTCFNGNAQILRNPTLFT